METYKDKETGYEIRVLTDTESWSTKPYFDYECTTADDSRVFVSESVDGKRNLWFVDVTTGEKDLYLELGSGDRFGVPLNRDYGFLFKGEDKGIYRSDLVLENRLRLERCLFVCRLRVGTQRFKMAHLCLRISTKGNITLLG